MKQLHISPELQLPLDWMSLATVVYGARGSGKTTFGSVAAEEVTKAKQRFCAIDLKGDWYGLKSTADGRGEGIPVVVFGGDHADLPLDEQAGAFIGKLVAELQHSCILDLEQLSKGKQVRFLAAFFEALYDANREPLLLLCDEAQRYAPQGRMIDPDSAKCLGAVEDAVKLGRKHGLGVVLFTQRGSGLNKEVSELCDLLVAFRTPGPLDQDRVKDWLEANVTKEQRDSVMGTIASLPTGTAIFASAHPDLALFTKARIRRRETFDSSATPRIGHKREEPKKLAPVDLARLREQMSTTIEKAKADDPRELRKRIHELETAVSRLKNEAAKPQVEVREVRVEVPVLDRTAVRRIQDQIERWLLSRSHAIQIELEATIRGLDEAIQLATSDPPVAALGVSVSPAQRKRQVSESLSRSHRGDAGAEGLTPPSRSVTSPRPVPPAAKWQPNGSQMAQPVSDGKLGLGERKVLAVLAQWPDGRAQKDVAFLAGYSAKASTLGVILSKLRQQGLVYPGQPVKATTEGLASAGGVQELPQGEDLLNHWLSHPRMGEGERKVLRALIEAYPQALTHDELSAVTGYSPSASTLGVILSKLRKLGLVESGGRRVPDSFMEAIA